MRPLRSLVVVLIPLIFMNSWLSAALGGGCSKSPPPNCFDPQNPWYFVCATFVPQTANNQSQVCGPGCSRGRCDPGTGLGFRDDNGPACMNNLYFNMQCHYCSSTNGLTAGGGLGYSAFDANDQIPADLTRVTPDSDLTPMDSMVFQFSKSMDASTLQISGAMGLEAAPEVVFSTTQFANDTLTIKPITKWVLGSPRSITLEISDQSGHPDSITKSFSVRDPVQDQVDAAAAIFNKAASWPYNVNGWLNPGSGVTGTGTSGGYFQVFPATTGDGWCPFCGAVGGMIYYSPATGAHVAYGGILAAYLGQGGPGGWLGLPVSDEYGCFLCRREDFQHGSITIGTWPFAIPAIVPN